MTDVMSRVHDHLDESLTNQESSVSSCKALRTMVLKLLRAMLIVTPTFDEVVLNKKPISTTHVRAYRSEGYSIDARHLPQTEFQLH